MKVELDGRVYDYDPLKISLQQGVAIFLAYGFTIDGFNEAMAATDPRALQCAYWLMLQQNGEICTIKDADADLLEFITALADAQAAEAAAEQPAPEPDPEPEPDPTFPPVSAASPAPASPTTTTPPHPAGEGGYVTAS